MYGVTGGNYWQEIGLQKRIIGRKRRRRKHDLDINKTVNCLILEDNKNRRGQAEDIEDFLAQKSHTIFGVIYCVSLINIKVVLFT